MSGANSIKVILEGSLVLRFLQIMKISFICSKTKKLIGIFSFYWKDSVCGRFFVRFAQKKPSYQNSFYQKTLDQISDCVSSAAIPLNVFFVRMMSGSAIYSAFFGFARNRAENKLRAAAVFGLYFFLAASGLGLLGIIGRGRAAVSFALAILCFIIAFAAEQISGAFRDSFFVKLVLGLIR